uniref:TIMELESS-interacting protein n=1 Tax=Heliothis virescens TaxID=7102 RepID=A0A2A4JMF2_HELVI
MSLLEDIFLQDEADEAQELERVIEGDEYDERPRSRSATPDSDDNGPKEDEAEEDKRRVDPSSTKTKRVIKNPRFILNPARLTGPRGIQIIPDHFKDFKFKGKGHEKEDLDIVLKKLEHWAYRLYPKFQFEDCLKKIETLGKKRPVMVHLHKIRTDQFLSEETVVQKDSSDEETQPPQEEDEFDMLLQQQIELARATPAPGSVKKVMATPMKDRSPFTMPKATSSPSISDEQKERMIRNRRLAEERRLARLKQASLDSSNKQDSSNNISQIIEVDEDLETSVTAKKNNRSHVIDSSDDECDVTSVNQSVAVDVHNGTNPDDKSNKDNNDVSNSVQKNLDDVEMDVIELVDTEKSKDNEIRSHTKISDDVIEINDPNLQVNSNKDTVVSEVIEINDQSNKVSPTRNMNNIGVDEIIVIPDPNDKVDQSKTSANEIIEINDQAVSIDEEVIQVSDSNNTEAETVTNIIKIPENKNLEEESSEKDTDSSASHLEKEAKMADEVIEDIMDVDFSDDF